MSFSADWLALRAKADRRARSDLAERLADLTDALPRPLKVIDLGSGTGANVRELFPKIRPPQDWTLVDADAELLKRAKVNLEHHAGLRIALHHADLMVEPLWTEHPHIVTAAALFDIVSEAFVDRLASALARQKTPLFSVLTYDGRLKVTPDHPFDAAMIDAFNAHQRGEKSFGRALGPDASDTLTATLRRYGATVLEDDSPWRLEARQDNELMQAKFDGWAAAAREMMPDQADEIDDWRAARRTAATVFVGHRDHLATF